MPRNRSEAVPEGNDPVPHQDEFGPDQPTMADLYQMIEERFDRQLNLIKSHFDQQDEKLDELMEKMTETNQRLAGLEHKARQPRLAMEVDVTPDTKTRKRTEDAAADRAKHGDSSSAKRVDASPTSSTSFGMTAESPALLCRDYALVDKGAEAPKAVSLTYGDAHANIRWWHTVRQHSLYSDEGHISPAASLELLPDRRDEFWDEICHVQQISVKYLLPRAADSGKRRSSKRNQG